LSVIETDPERPAVAIIGGGPAGLAAAEALAADADVHVFDAMPSLGRKFLLAGKSGLNLTHAEDLELLLTRFGPARAALEPALRDWTPAQIRSWATELGIATFVGTSGRVFPTCMKASPLLRAWLGRLRAAGVNLHLRHRWQGWNDAGALVFATPDGAHRFNAAATILALGGASWPRLGSDGAWTEILARRDIEIHPLRPANCGFDVDWTPHFLERFAGAPVKSVVFSLRQPLADQPDVGDRPDATIPPGAGDPAVASQLPFAARGDFVVTSSGIEGSALYALSAALRDAIETHAVATLQIDLAPGRSHARLAADLSRPRDKASLSNHLRKAAGLAPVKIALLRECCDTATLADPQRLASAIKSLPLTLARTRPLAEAISSAGGVALTEVDDRFMLRKAPGVFVAGEMLDWEAPTGGYLLTACLATGRAAGRGAAAWLARDRQ
jgi:predicted flavoprotein YhiN